MWLIVAAAMAANEPCQADCETLPAVETVGQPLRRTLPDGAISIDVEAAPAAPLMDVAELFARVPGVVARARENYAQDTQISVRGFGARASFGVRGVRLEADGLPLTAADGQTQIGHLDLIGAERIDAITGPFAALYGNGGAYFDVRERRQPVSSVRWFQSSGGRSQHALALAGEQLFARAQAIETRGARAQSAAERRLYRVGYRFETPQGEFNISADRQEQPDSLDPQGLTRAEFERDPRAASPQALAFNTRKSVYQDQLSVRFAASGAFDWDAGAQLSDRSVDQVLSLPPNAQLAPTNGGGVIDLERRSRGLFWRATHDLAGGRLSARLQAEHLDERRLGFENFVGTTLGQRGALRRDEDNRAQTRDAMLRFDRSYAGLDWSAGVRRTSLDYASDDDYIRPGNPDDSGRYEASAWLPVAGVAWRAAQWQSAFAAGRAIDVPTLAELAYRSDGDGGFNQALQPSKVRQAEWSLGWRRARQEAMLALFTVHGRDEIVVQSNEGGRTTFANAGRSRRRGVDADWRWSGERASLSLSATYTDAQFVEGFFTCQRNPCPAPDLRVPEGAPLPGVPRFFGEIEWRWRTTDLLFGADIRGASETTVSERFADATPGYGVLDLSLQRTLNIARQPVRLTLRVDNVLDRNYSNSAIINDVARRYFEPAPGRSFWIGIDARLPAF